LGSDPASIVKDIILTISDKNGRKRPTDAQVETIVKYIEGVKRIVSGGEITLKDVQQFKQYFTAVEKDLPGLLSGGFSHFIDHFEFKLKLASIWVVIDRLNGIEGKLVHAKAIFEILSLIYNDIETDATGIKFFKNLADYRVTFAKVQKAFGTDSIFDTIELAGYLESRRPYYSADQIIRVLNFLKDGDFTNWGRAKNRAATSAKPKQNTILIEIKNNMQAATVSFYLLAYGINRGLDTVETVASLRKLRELVGAPLGAAELIRAVSIYSEGKDFLLEKAHWLDLYEEYLSASKQVESERRLLN
jgi:hypothetical protein